MDKGNEKVVRAEYNGVINYGFLEDSCIEWARGEIPSLERTGDFAEIDRCKLLAPLTPQKIIIIAINYDDKKKIPVQEREAPIVVLKPLTTLIGPGDNIIYPQNTNAVNYEAEVAVVIGKSAKNVSVEDAMDYVFGFTLVNDVTDAERLTGQWTFGKGHDTFLPMGPAIVVSQDYRDITVEGYLNGARVQNGHWRHLIRSVPELICLISSFMTLVPGDVICAGTPSGIGRLQRGDVFTVKNEFIGELTNRVV